MRILWVKTGPLLPLDTGGKRRTHAMLTEMSREHEVTYLALLPEGCALHPAEEADAYARTKIWVTASVISKHTVRFWWQLMKSTLCSSKPYALEKYEAPQLREKLRELARTDAFDLVICDFLAPALNFSGLSFSAPRLLFEHNMEAQIWQRLAASQSSLLKRWYFKLQHRRMERWEARLCREFDGVITVSPEDSEIAMKDYGLTNVLGHVPTGVDVSAFKAAKPGGPDAPFTTGFLGSMDWMPNIDACLYFVREILPRVRAELPEARFLIIGRNPPASIRQLACADDRVEVTGTVEDVQPCVHRCHAIAIPLVAGGGTRIKIYEAMAMGVPVVSTTIGAEGLEVSHGEDILLADEPQAFAAALVALARDSALREKLAAHARRAVESRHSWAAATRRFMELCAHALPLNHPPS
ncbi:glycosyltransferase family 4 protein [Prosthecobacter sp.]|uniref:glycosyltransferase family 4 protein n=1 Tax=Prosthecobacter sp. TaxID=1965333 RepID=UPI0037845509